MKSQFEEQPSLSHAMVHYLKAIHDLFEENGYVRAVDLTNYTGKSRGTVSIILQKLLSQDYITIKNKKFINLTEKGHSLSDRFIDTNRVLYDFLLLVLKVSKKTAMQDACEIENHLSPESFEALTEFMAKWKDN